MSFDNLCKLLAEKHPQRFATWILGESPPSLKVLKTELSIEPIRADSVIFLQTAGQILHLEFQVEWRSNPPMPLRLLDYWVRLHRLYRMPITQVVVVLLQPSEDTEIETVFQTPTTRHEYQVIKLWEQPPEPFLQDPVLLPFATLTQTQDPERLLDRVVQQVAALAEADERREVSGYVQLMAGLKYDKSTIRRVFREGMMRESVIYQEIFQEGEQVGEARGRQTGQRSLILLLLQQRIGPVSAAQTERMSQLTLEQMEALALALFNFTTAADLENWLSSVEPN
jgi:predicted transposase/invertase (TIGR01784 family)